MADSEASEAGRALVAIRWKRTTAEERSKVAKTLVTIREQKRKAKSGSKSARSKRSGP